MTQMTRELYSDDFMLTLKWLVWLFYDSRMTLKRIFDSFMMTLWWLPIYSFADKYDSQMTLRWLLIWLSWLWDDLQMTNCVVLKFGYSEKAIKFEKIFHLEFDVFSGLLRISELYNFHKNIPPNGEQIDCYFFVWV